MKPDKIWQNPSVKELKEFVADTYGTGKHTDYDTMAKDFGLDYYQDVSFVLPFISLTQMVKPSEDNGEYLSFPRQALLNFDSKFQRITDINKAYLFASAISNQVNAKELPEEDLEAITHTIRPSSYLPAGMAKLFAQAEGVFRGHNELVSKNVSFNNLPADYKERATMRLTQLDPIHTYRT